MTPFRILPRLSPTGLFGIFILISFLACTLLGGSIIAYRTQQTTIEQQRQASQHELKFAASFLELFLQETLDDLRSVAASPIVINDVMDGGEGIENLNLIAYREDETLTFFDLNLDIIYSNSERRVSSSVSRHQARMLNAILDGKREHHVFLDDFNGSMGITFAVPVTYAGSVEGVLLADLPAVASKLFPEFTENHRTSELIGEQHSFAALDIASRDDWLWLEESLSLPNLTLRLGLSSEPQRAQQHATIKSMLLSILVAFSLSFALVYWIGRKILLNPYRELETSRELLAKNAKSLEASEREARRTRSSSCSATSIKLTVRSHDGSAARPWGSRPLGFWLKAWGPESGWRAPSAKD